jgi:hypothetical protein
MGFSSDWRSNIAKSVHNLGYFARTASDSAYF